MAFAAVPLYQELTVIVQKLTPQTVVPVGTDVSPAVENRLDVGCPAAVMEPNSAEPLFQNAMRGAHQASLLQPGMTGERRATSTGNNTGAGKALKARVSASISASFISA